MQVLLIAKYEDAVAGSSINFNEASFHVLFVCDSSFIKLFSELNPNMLFIYFGGNNLDNYQNHSFALSIVFD